jgi:hypothetical protein
LTNSGPRIVRTGLTDSLADYPDGSLGRAFHTFYAERQLLFPGEKGGAPESIVAHDLTHVLDVPPR